MFSVGSFFLGLAALAGARASLPNGDFTFELGSVTYLAATSQPVAAFNITLDLTLSDEFIPLTVINATSTVVTESFLQQAVKRYSGDDVFTPAFLDTVLVYSSHGDLEIRSSALEYLSRAGAQRLLVRGGKASGNSTVNVVAVHSKDTLAPGPYIATIKSGGLQISKVFRLYADNHGAFMNGVYPSDTADSFQALALWDPELGHPLIPVPSRIHSWYDERPLAGERVGVKDIYDLKGLKTTRGSISFTKVTSLATFNAVSVQRLLDLGAVIVGKQNTAQFASGADAWDWTDFQHPFNPRGDGYLTCSSSSAGSACAVAAYDWLDYSIGSDTGQSVRRPAAVAGVFGNRPSQGLMSTDGVMPISYSTDALGVFSRDPLKWAYFAKHWYTPTLYQNQSMTHLPALQEANSSAFPTRLLYTVDYLPLQNPAAEAVLQRFIANLTAHFNMTVDRFNFSSSIKSLSPTVPQVQNLSTLVSHLNTLWTTDQLTDVVRPFVTAYASQYNSYPPLDIPNRASFRQSPPSESAHVTALTARAAFSQAWEDLAFGASKKQCSESILLYDIGSGGLPSFREKDLNEDSGAMFLSQPGSLEAGGNICSFVGCADFTVPIGQVKYYSNVTFEEVNVPVTVSMVVRRGCDRVLFEFIEALVERGVVRGVQTGKNAF